MSVWSTPEDGPSDPGGGDGDGDVEGWRRERSAVCSTGHERVGAVEGWWDGPPSEGPPTPRLHNIAHLGQPPSTYQSTRRRRGGRGTGPATTRYSPGATGNPPRRRRGHRGRRRRGHHLRVTGSEVVRVDGRSGARPDEIAQGTARATSTDVSRGRFWWGKKSPIQKWSGWRNVLVHSPQNAEWWTPPVRRIHKREEDKAVSIWIRLRI